MSEKALRYCPCCGDDPTMSVDADGNGTVYCEHCGVTAPALTWLWRADDDELGRLRRENAELREGSARLLSMSRDVLATEMANCGLVDHAAVEDPEGYDGGVTLDRVGRFKERMAGK